MYELIYFSKLIVQANIDDEQTKKIREIVI